MVTHTSGLTSLRTGDSRALVLRGERLSRQSLFSCSASEDLIRRSREQIIASRSRARECRRPLISALNPIIRQKLRSGRLPSARPVRIFGGPGAGGQCAACNRPLRETQLVMELPCDGQVLLLHGDCFIVWDVEDGAVAYGLRPLGLNAALRP